MGLTVVRQSVLIKAARGDNGNRDGKVGERVEDLRIAPWYRVGTLRDVFGPRKQIVTVRTVAAPAPALAHVIGRHAPLRRNMSRC
jgi:hypothetical protein